MHAKNFEINTRRQWMVDIFFLALAIGTFYFLFLGSYPLFTPDEGRYSEVAREMVATGDYITPRVNGVVFLDKPILYYWLQAAAILLFGIKEWSLRFFPALLGIFGCLVTYVCGTRLFNRQTGLLSALILATSPLYFIGAHYANLDLEMAVLISCTLLFFITGVQSSGTTRTRYLIATYCFAALAMLTKGLISIAFPALIIGAWITLLWRWSLLKKIHLVTGIILFLAIISPWYILAQRANPEFLHFFFITQHLTRFLSGAEFNNQLPGWYYFAVLLVGFFPWIIFLVQSMSRAYLHVWKNRAAHAVELYLLLWIVIIFTFFSIPHSKIATYLLPIFPALALLTGKFLVDNFNRRLISLFFIALACSVMMLLTLVLSANEINQNTAKPLINLLKPIIKPTDEIVNYYKFYQDVPIYLERRVTLVADWQSPNIIHKDNWVRELWFGMGFQKTDDWLINENTFWQRWNSHKRVFTFVNDNYLGQFKARAKKYYLIARYNDIYLISNERSKTYSR